MSLKETLEKFDQLPKEDICIEVNHVTKDYGRGRGIFDISFKVPRGKVFGYCGTNGAGKTTTLRTIMGFIKPDEGSVTVNGLDSLKDAEKIKQYVGYLPGEIAFPQVESGSDFLKIQAEMIGLKDMSKAERIINMMQLDPTANLKRMSKGMKQKTAIVVAFMNSPDIILLDEPTTGLDPLMREAFKELIKEEKERGTTIIMSNHMFDELEETCDYVGFILNGHLVDIVDLQEMKNRPYREFKLGFTEEKDCQDFNPPFIQILNKKRRHLNFRIDLDKINLLFKELEGKQIEFLSENQYSLEKYFMENVVGGENDGSSGNRNA